MASRRTRIKGIANIPQRRKPTVEAATEAEIQSEDAKCAETNLHSSPQQQVNQVISATAAESLESKANNEQNDVDNVGSTAVVENDKVECATEVANIAINSKTVNVDIIKTDKESAPVPQATKKPSFSRRRFIKPAISLKAIQKSTTSPSISPCTSPTEELQTPKAQEEPNPSENANDSPAAPKTVEHQPTNAAKLMQIQTLAPVISNTINKEISVLGIIKLPLSQNQNLDNHFADNSKIDEVVRPPPACSPSKYMNRRIKAVPRLGQRRPSFSIGSASESEDESKKSHKTHRIRNDSVCSTVSAPAPPESPAANSEAGNPRKKPEFNSVIQRKCRRTEQSRKLAEARRDFQQKFSNGKPDRQKLTMIDLIFYNPSSSPMSQKRKRLDTDCESIISTKNEEDIDDAPAPEEPPPSVEANGEVSDEENTVPAPQITIGANGEIIVDEKSLYIENKDVKRDRELLKNSNLVDGDKFDVSYGVFKRVKRSKDWNKDETLRFYKALNTIGTDFTLMCELFPGRSRRELKMKFKKEERVNRALIDRAVMQPIQFDITDLQRDLEKQELEKMRNEQLKKDQQQCREERKAAKEKEKIKLEDVSQVKKKRRTVKRVVNESDEDSEEPRKPLNAKEALKNKLQQGINSLIESDDSDIEDVTVVDNLSNKEKPEINENNNHIDLNSVIDEESTDKNLEITTVEESTDISEITVDESSLESRESTKTETQPEVDDTIVEGSIVVSSTLDANGKEIYSVFSVNKHGEKIPMDLNQDVLDVLLKNQKPDDTLTSNSISSLPDAADESVILPSDNTIDNIMADISLSTIHDHPELDLSTADCMVLSFDDIDVNIAANSTAQIVAVQPDVV